MAGWLDYLDQQSRRPRSYRVASFRPRFDTFQPQKQGYNPYEVSRSSAPLSSSTAPRRSSTPAAPGSSAVAAPERFDASIPYARPAAAPSAPVISTSTQGDIFGSIGAALGDTTQGVNMANAIPWLLERVNVFSKQLADESPDGTPQKAIARGADLGTGAFLDAFEAAAGVVGPLLDGLPSFVRDSQLKDRAKIYRSILSGEAADFGPLGPASNPLDTVAQIAALPITLPGNAIQRAAAYAAPGSPLEEAGRWMGQGGPASFLFGDTQSRQASEYNVYRDVLLNSLSPDAQANAQTRIAIIRDSVDLPESVKTALGRNPRMSDEELDKLLAAAPEGKQWSYQEGVKGLVQNLGNPFVIYGAEAYGLGKLAGGQTVSPGITKAVSIAAKIQKAYLASGLGMAGLTTAMDTIARVQGNQEAIDWFQRVSQPGEFAENPNVQLVSGFSVNPFEGVGALKKGVVKLANGAGNVIVGKSLGQRFLRYHDADNLVYGQLAKMYRLSGPEEAKAFAHDNGFYDTKGEVFDEVVGLAADHVLETKLRREERMAFLAAHPDPIDLTKAVLSTYGEEIMSALENNSDEIAQRWFQRSWEYHQYPGQFHSEVAALNARDYRLAKGKTYALRQQIDAVVGYQEFMGPEATARARTQLERIASNGVVRIEGRNGLQDLVRQYPALRKYWQGLVRAGDTTISKDAVETMLQRADRDYATASKQNPVRVRTGADPVIRPDSPRRDLERAEALGTNVETIRAIDDGAEPANVELFRQYLTDKGLVEPEIAASMGVEDAWTKAAEHVYNTERPWVQTGERVVAAEKEITRLRSELLRLRSMDPKAMTLAHREAIPQIERQLETLMGLVRYASDPVVPFADDIVFERMASRRADQVRKMNPDRLTPANVTFLREYVTEGGDILSSRLSGRDLWEAANDIAERAPRVTGQDVSLAQRAARKVEAIAALERLQTIDDAASQLGFDGGSGWANLVRKGANGEWQWSGGMPPVTRGMRQRLGSWFLAHGKPGLGRAIMEVGDEELWSIILRQVPESQDGLTRTMRNYVGRMVAENAGGTPLGSTRVDEFAQAAIDRGEVTSTDEFLQRVFRLADEREQLLSDAGGPRGLEVANLQRRAGMDVPPEYVREAESNLDARSVYYDAEFEAIIHPDNVQKVVAILDNPGELYPGLHEIVASDPILEAGAAKVAARYDTTIEAVLRDPTYAPALRTEMVPPDFAPREPGVQAVTELDALLMADDLGTIAQRNEELVAAANGPHEAIQTTVSRARRVRAEHPSRTWRERLALYGADLTESPSAAILDDPANRAGVDVLSLLNHGVVGTRPATLRGVLHILAAIEHGNGVRMGLGPSLLAEGQRVANALLRDAVEATKRRPFAPGTFGPGLDPASFAIDELELARALAISDIDPRLAPDMDNLTRNLRGTLRDDEIIAGRERQSQAANAALGEARGAQSGTGGAVREIPASSGPQDEAFIATFREDMVDSGWSPDFRFDPVGRPNAIEKQIVSVDLPPDVEVDFYESGVAPKSAAVYMQRDAAGELAGYAVFPLKADGTADAVSIVHVRPSNQRSGIATRLYDSAEADGLKVRRVSGRFGTTDAGTAFSKAYLSRPAAEATNTGGRIDLTDPALQADLRASVDIRYSPDDPLGSLQYGFKKRPKDAVVMELSKVPSLAEEFVTERFQTWQERAWTGRVRQAYNYVFGPLANNVVANGVRQRFVERLAKQGIDGEVAEAIWSRWKKEADNSREPEIRVDAKGRREFHKGDNPLYASVGNIPNARMDQWAHEALDQLLEIRRSKGLLDEAYRDMARTINYSDVFRESASFTRRNLMDLPAQAGHENLGKALASAYGKVFHNKAATTLYYWFRFGLDVRYHAMNFFEPQLLYLGRAGLRHGEIDAGMLGQTEGFLRKLDQDYIDNTGYATSRSRFAYAYRTFLKEQPDALRGKLRGLQAEDPQLMERVMQELTEYDPELKRLIADMGDTPQGYLRAMDQWHKKMLDSVTENADGSLTIDEEIANEIAKTPAMAEVYGSLSQVNKELWASVKETFYGNANRSRAERFLNSYLLFWPLSYQIKSSKWLLRVLYDRAGGLQTNAAGAVILSRAAESHQQLLATDPEYRDWFERHPTMVFVAQMLLPITPDSIGVSLNPALRSLFFGRSKAFWDIGPVYTVRHVVQPGMEELGADLYPALGDVPGIDGLYRATTGKAPKPDWAQD